MKTFIAAHGQTDNVGDSVLRRAMLESFVDPDIERHILVGMNSADYAAGLGLRPADRVYESRAQWQRAALRAAVTERVTVVTNAGEVQLNRRRTKIALADIPMTALARARGGRSIQTGIGFRRPEGRFPWQIAVVSRMSGIATWRDEPSRAYARVGETAPDWAFALAGSGARRPTRDLLVVTMRGDRDAAPQQLLDAIAQVSAERRLRPVVVNQVVRDLRRSEELASALDAELVAPWRGGRHDLVEPVLRDVYAGAELVVSDRLHALVIGLTEGALPVGATTGSAEKLDRTFAAAGMADVSFDSRDLAGEDILARMHRICARREELVAQTERARLSLAELSVRMRRHALGA